MKVTWIAPSNIALVKYWGKYGNQLPKNPSLSFTLKNSVTELSIETTKSENQQKMMSLNFYFDGELNTKFRDKIIIFLNSQLDRFPWLLNYHLEIHSKNTFPHSSGIASSASSMSALCLSLLSLDEMIKGVALEKSDFFKAASELSRLASGSASRSVYGGLVSWGESESIPLSSNEYAQVFLQGHSQFEDFCDSILIVDSGEKSVSSRAGHGLMENHPYSDIRHKEAFANLEKLIVALKTGDIESFISVVEEEALTLHALMMTSRPSYILLKPNSLELIEKIRLFRNEKKIPVCFTIDAGPNIHLLYPKKFKSEVCQWIETELAHFLVGARWIHDEVGSGPKLLESTK
jgi:diphosphomevalonate decarboxylase